MTNTNKKMYDLCKKYMHSYVLAELNDGTTFDGIITGVDDEYAYFAVPNEMYEQISGPTYQHDSNHETRYFGYGYPGYGPGYGYGFYGRPQRFRRFILPFAALTALSLLPWY